MSYLEGALPSMEELLNMAAELGGEDAVAGPIEATLDSGGYKNVLVDIDQEKLSPTAKAGFETGILKHQDKRTQDELKGPSARGLMKL